MHYKTITAGELRTMDGVKVKAQASNGVIIEGFIHVYEGHVDIIDYNRIVLSCLHRQNEVNSSETTGIYRLETIDDFVEGDNSFTEGEEVYVSDESFEDAIIKKEIRAYIFTYPFGRIYKYACAFKNELISGEDYFINDYKYIAKIPKEETVEMTMEEVCKALGKKVKIIE